MNQPPTFDPARSKAIDQMLIKRLERDTKKATGPARRIALVVSLTVAALLLATGGTAIALSGGRLALRGRPCSEPYHRSRTNTFTITDGPPDTHAYARSVGH